MLKELIKVEERDGIPTVNARELHSFLEVKKTFADWIRYRIDQYDFFEGEDYISFSQFCEKPQGGRPKTEYFLTLTMAKELAMVENNEKGKQLRHWFIRKQEQFDAMRTAVEHNKRQRLLSASEVAQWLGVSPRTVSRMFADGRLKGIRLGNHLFRYKREDVESLLETGIALQATLPFEAV